MSDAPDKPTDHSEHDGAIVARQAYRDADHEFGKAGFAVFHAFVKESSRSTVLCIVGSLMAGHLMRIPEADRPAEMSAMFFIAYDQMKKNIERQKETEAEPA